MWSKTIGSLLASSRLGVVGFTAAAFLFACAQAAPNKKKAPDDSTDDTYNSDTSPTDGDPPLPEQVNDNSGAFSPSARPASSDGGADAGTSSSDAGTGPVSACGDSVAPGDLAIVEMMIDSRPGMGDDGEWAEVKNTRNCTLKLKGVTVESPRGAAAPDVATITDDVELPPGATFLVANTSDATKNNGLPGALVAWNDTDVLKNAGDTLSVKLGTVVIDSVTYPDLSNLSPGRSFAFPNDCPLADRSDWRRWSLTFTEYAPGLKGTPNAPNADVACF
jgi:hypothetical protein